MDMAIVPVDIELNDLRAYTQVAFFLDSPLLLKDIARIRKKFGIKAPLPSENYDIDGTFMTVGPSVEDLIEGKYQEDKNFVNLGQDFHSEITNTRKSYHYPEMFDAVLKQAVMFNKVNKYKTAYPTYYVTPQPAYRANVQEWSDSPQQEAYMAIVVTPYSTEKDIMEAFRNCRDVQRVFVESYSPIYRKLAKDTVSNIQRDRKWYWDRLMNKELRYEDMLDEWNTRSGLHERASAHPKSKRVRCEKCIIEDTNYIETAVSEYRRNLKAVSL